MIFHILVVCIFLLASGRPIAVASITETCSEDTAKALAQTAEAMIGGEFQDSILGECLDAIPLAST